MTGKRGEHTHLSGYPGLATALLNRAVRDAKLTGWRRAEAVLFLSSAGCGELIVNLGDAMDVPIGKSAQRALLHELGVGHILRV